MAAPRYSSQRITLLMLVLASITAITLDYHGEASRGIGHVRNGVRDALAPFQRAIAFVLHPVGDAFSGAIHYGQLAAQNAQLRRELGAAQLALASRAAAARAESRLLALSHLPFLNPGISTVPAQVISAPTSNFQATVELDVGTSSGVGKGMPVVADGGLVGTVTSASSSTSTVLLVSDSSASVAVRDVRTNALFIANGTGLGRALSLSSDGTNASAAVGDRLVTSGYDLGAYPAGIPVGVVSSVRAAAGGVTQAVSVRPLVNLDNLEYVSVLQWLQPA
ncbi:MAG TPA: rod shape-determining protein MreC [Acidimicrobiales bacterium]|nr:rod shape-determining protein MreC [Acidimicrobiales bacterium]